MAEPFASPAIITRRKDFGDFDLIVTFLTLEFGKLTVIAKNAKKSVKRFQGALEPFSVLHSVWTKGRGHLPILKEVMLEHPFSGLRTQIRKTAMASYWAELINTHLEAEKPQPALYTLFFHVLKTLDQSPRLAIADELSLLFQSQFLKLAGIAPTLGECLKCRTGLEGIPHPRIRFAIAGGGIVCDRCYAQNPSRTIQLAKGTIKQLIWVQNCDLEKSHCLLFSPLAVREGTAIMEAFIQFHLGERIQSLKFLQNLRHDVLPP